MIIRDFTIDSADDLNSINYIIDKFFPYQDSEVRCINTISYSGWNPPPRNRLLQGDIWYLDIKTLERFNFLVLSYLEKDYCITCSVKGFYVNESTNHNFNPTKMYFIYEF